MLSISPIRDDCVNLGFTDVNLQLLRVAPTERNAIRSLTCHKGSKRVEIQHRLGYGNLLPATPTTGGTICPTTCDQRPQVKLSTITLFSRIRIKDHNNTPAVSTGRHVANPWLSGIDSLGFDVIEIGTRR